MILAVACSIGLHWALFQSVAWVSMVVQYSHEASFEEAVLNTFDGQHPCPLCKQIAQGRQTEKKSDAQTAERKLEFSFSTTEFIFRAPRRFWLVGCEHGSAEPRALAPPVPPPRLPSA